MPQYIASCLVDIPFSALIPVEEVSDAEAAAELSVAETAESSRGATSSVGSSGVAVVAASILFGATETLGVEADPIAEVEEEAAVAGATSRDAAALSSVGAGGAGTGMPCTVRKRKRDPRVRKRRVYILARNR
jgi:hypothetical protein